MSRTEDARPVVKYAGQISPGDRAGVLGVDMGVTLGARLGIEVPRLVIGAPGHALGP